MPTDLELEFIFYGIKKNCANNRFVLIFLSTDIFLLKNIYPYE